MLEGKFAPLQTRVLAAERKDPTALPAAVAQRVDIVCAAK